MHNPRWTMRRRAFLQLSATEIAVAAMGVAACGGRSSEPGAPPPSSSAGPGSSADGAAAKSTSTSKVLLVYFSRAGENYYNGGRRNLTVGNTEVAATMIHDALACDVFRIQPTLPYSDSYDDTVARNVREQNENARPVIANLPANIDAYDTILLGSPIWNVRPPRIMLTFAERFDFTGKRILPFTTYAVSGLGQVVAEYTAACRGATFGEALAIRGEEVEQGRSAVEGWLRRVGLLA